MIISSLGVIHALFAEAELAQGCFFKWMRQEIAKSVPIVPL
jgi:hypothetical protein